MRAAAPLDDIDQFDAAFFGMSPRDAAVFDPQHRLFLECAWEAFEDAGYVGERIDGAVGVFASCGLSEYMFKNVLANEHVATSVGEWLVRHTGNDTNFLATRVSYELDLHGPSLNVQTACSSTLVAVHLACQSLLSGECDVALAGGAVVAPVQRARLLLQGGRDPLARRPLPGVRRQVGRHDHLQRRRLRRAQAARRTPSRTATTCWRSIRGSAINNDGRAKVGYLAPSVPGQAQVVTEALAVAGVDARDVTYIEAHGTGTLIGDPIEIAGLTQAFRLGTDDTAVLRHRLAEVEHRPHRRGGRRRRADQDGPRAAARARSRRACTSRSPTRRPTSRTARSSSTPSCGRGTPGPGGTRIAGITGLGAGGTNAHVDRRGGADASSRRARRARHQLITVSARTADAARRAAADLAAHLRAHPDIDLADVAFTRLAGRKPFAHAPRRGRHVARRGRRRSSSGSGQAGRRPPPRASRRASCS